MAPAQEPTSPSPWWAGEWT